LTFRKISYKKDYGRIHDETIIHDDVLERMNNTQSRSDITDFFLEDASEHLNNINDDLLTLENNRDEPGLVDKIFRSVHAIKGSAGMAGFHVTSQLAHRVEDLLGQIRSQELAVSGELIDLLFQGIDALTHEVENISNDEEEDESLLAIFTDLRADFLGQPAPETSQMSAQIQPQAPSSAPQAPTPKAPSEQQPSVSPLELAERLIRQEQVEKAVAVYQKLVREDPSNAMLRQRLAETKALHAYIQKFVTARSLL
jgi:two-component system chemotaxis sensor kinase CheA